MSLINKMLQDLDARGSQGGAPLQSEVRPVERPGRRLPLPVALVSLISAVSLAAGGYFALKFYQERQVARPAPGLAQAAAPAPAAPAPAPAPIEAVAAPLEAAAPTAPPAAVAQPVPEQPKSARPPMRKAVKKAPARQAAVPEPAAQRTPGGEPRARAENEYRRALASLAEGRVSDSIAMLEAALRLDPRHDGARQTLVGLLVENKRHDEAMGHLQAALAQDPRQPAMAMLLARMQIERGGDGIDTLMRTLPAAAGRAEYHAFLAGALARAERQREAAEQYQAALRSAPNNGVWLMGLGIALQGDGRDAEALAAYQRARSSEGLPAQLQAFVERKINQLAR